MTQQQDAIFIGRDEELSLIARLIEDRSGAIIRVSGEAGVGKSRLVAESLHRAGIPYLSGLSSPASLGRPFDLLLSAVEPAVRQWTSCPSSLSGVRGALSHLLRGVAPALKENGDSDGQAPAPTELISAGIALVRHLDPEAILLEDLHWADIESLRVVERLVSAPDHPAVILTYRTEDLVAASPSAELVRAIESRHRSHVVHLRPFDRDTVQQFAEAWLGSPVDELTSERLRTRTGGSPFFLEQLLAATESGGTDSQRLQQLPATLSETVHLRLHDLDEDERDLLITAAVLGSRFDFDLLMAALDIAEPVLIQRLRRVVGRQLLVEGELDNFHFRHELVRESLLESLLGRECRQLHERAWQAVSQVDPDDFAELARHADGAGRLDELLEFAPRGVRHYLSLGSSYQAMVLAERALRQSPDHLELHELAARAGWLCGSLERARFHAQRWRELEKGSEQGREAEALAMLGRIAFELGEDDVEDDILEQLEDAQRQMLDPAARARLLAWIAQHQMLRGNSEEAVEKADLAIELATVLGQEDLVRQSLVEKGSAYLYTPEHREEGREILRQVAKSAEAAGEFVSAARAWHNLVPFEDPVQVDATLEAMRDAAERGGFECVAVSGFAFRKIEAGLAHADLHETLQWIGRSTQTNRKTKTGAALASVELILALEASVELDSQNLAARILELKNNGPSCCTPWMWALELVLAARQHNDESLTALLKDLATGEEYQVMLGWALRYLRDAQVDPELIAESFAGDVNEATEERSHKVVAALVASYSNQPNAKTLLTKVIELQLPFVAPRSREMVPFGGLLEAECHLELARLAFLDGEQEIGHNAAATAAALLEKWPGSRRDAALALARHGKGGAQLDSDLTGRELDVTRLVATGMSNGEIAERLYISRKTVSTHVSHILAKLDMNSRTEVATWAVREGIAAG